MCSHLLWLHLQAGPRVLIVNGAIEGVNTSQLRKTLQAVENKSGELLSPYWSMDKPIPSIDLSSCAFECLPKRLIASFVLKVAKSHNWNNQTGLGMIRLPLDWNSFILATAWFKCSYEDPKISLPKQMSRPSCNCIARVVNFLGIYKDLEQNIYMENQ